MYRDEQSSSRGESVRLEMPQQLLLMDSANAYADQRASAMESIESSISELGQIFKQLATLVAEQGETIQRWGGRSGELSCCRIDMNIEETSVHVDAAHMELLKYLKNISGNRWLALKILGTLLAFFIIFIVFLT